ncbi:MAG: tetratricopeptide repeat protein [Chloroflexota bacterium]
MLRDHPEQALNGRYHLHEKLGQGGMGIVHRATDRLTGDTVALKQVFLPMQEIMFASRPLESTNRGLRLALANEFRILASIRHPHIISVLDYGFDQGGRPFFTMSHLKDTQTILKAGNGRSVSTKVRLLQQMLEALAYLHRRGILHRDIKPENVLVVNDSVRLLDFGLSATKEQAVASVGSWRYMAPELLQGEMATETADLYAVGVLAYQLFARHTDAHHPDAHPFAAYADDMRTAVLTQEPAWENLESDERITAVIRTLLEKNRQNRPQTAEEAIIAFNFALGEALPKETAAIRKSHLQAAKFVGREAEMAQLTAALTQAKDGAGTIWLVGGESGVGKTRLIEEFGTQAMVFGWQVLRGQAVASGSLPYQLWQNILPQLALRTTLSNLEASILCQVFPNIRSLLAQEIFEPTVQQGQEGQQRLIQTMVDVLKRQSQPILLLLEDLQWSHQSLDPLKQLLKISDQMPPFMVVGTYRSDERPELPQLLAGAETIMLERFSKAQIRQLSQAMLGKVTNIDSIVSLLARETEGNCYFVVEVMSALAEEAGQLDHIGIVPLPEGVFTRGMQELLQRRIQKVSLADQELLQIAAVAGRQIDQRLLQVVRPQIDLDGWLQRAAEVSILIIRDDQWLFAHDKLREVVLGDLTEETRRLFHRQVAEGLERVYPDNRNYHQALLTHWRQAQDMEQAMGYLLSVTHNLVEITANYATALDLLQIGLQTLPHKDDPRHVPLWNLQAKVYLYQGNYEKALSVAQQAQNLAAKLNDKNGLAMSLTTIGAVRDYYGEYEQAIDIFKQSLALNNALGDQLRAAENLAALGNLSAELKMDELALDYQQQSLRTYQALENQQGIARLLRSLGGLAIDRNDFEEATDYLQRSLTILQELGDQRLIAGTYITLGICARYQRNFDKAIEHLQKSVQIFESIGAQTSKSIGYNNLARVAYLQGDYRQAITYGEQSYAIRKANGYKYGQVFSLLILGFSYLKLQDAKAQEIFWEGLSIAESIHSSDLMEATIAGFAWLHQQRGNTAYAAELTSLVQWNDAVLWLEGLQPLLAASLGEAGLLAAQERGKHLVLQEVATTLLKRFAPA